MGKWYVGNMVSLTVAMIRKQVKKEERDVLWEVCYKMQKRRPLSQKERPPAQGERSDFIKKEGKEELKFANWTSLVFVWIIQNERIGGYNFRYTYVAIFSCQFFIYYVSPISCYNWGRTDINKIFFSTTVELILRKVDCVIGSFWL